MPPYLVGQLLLALPGIGDPRFEKAAIALCVHDAEGALGIGIGDTIEGLGLHGLLAQFDIKPGVAPDAPIHRGGPVETKRGFVLHSRDWAGQDSIDVSGKWVLSGTIDILRAIAQGTGPERWIVALGYAGWGPGQLDKEMMRHGWFVTEPSEALIFETAAPRRWAKGFAEAGVNSSLLAPASGWA